MRLFSAAFLLTATASAASSGSVGDLVTEIRAGVKARKPDSEIARTVHDAKLSEKLDFAVIEEMQSEGAGRTTLEELDRQRALTQKLAAPAEPPHLFDAPAPPTKEEQSASIEKARALAVEYTAKLPNFLCNELVRRFVDSRGSENWKPTDNYKMDVAYSEKGERYKLLEINGEPATRSLKSIGGFSSSGEFGSLQKWIFDPTSMTNFQWERWANLRGRMALVFSYRIDQPHSHYQMNWNTDNSKNYHGVMGMIGLVYIDRETSQVMRFSDEAEGIPADWPIRATPSVVDYDFAEVGGQRYLLPKRVESRVIFKKQQDRNIEEFSNFRKFAGEAVVSFDK